MLTLWCKSDTLWLINYYLHGAPVGHDEAKAAEEEQQQEQEKQQKMGNSKSRKSSKRSRIGWDGQRKQVATTTPNLGLVLSE